MRISSLQLLPATLAIATALGLAACGRQNEERTAGQTVDSAVSTVEKKSGEVAADVKKEVDTAGQAVGRAVEAGVEKVKDATITTSINAELARDSSLSALKINVDTTEGRVSLRGTAPSIAAREQATQLAQRVDGVISVDNQLQVSSN